MNLLEEVPQLPLQLLGNPTSVALATATAITSLYLYFVCPHFLVSLYFRFMVRWSGMRLKSIRGVEEDFIYTYGEKGRLVRGRPSIVLLHGFTADHFMWAPIVQHFRGDIHVVALDLPGHGFSSLPAQGDDIGFQGQLLRIRQFLKLMDLDQQKIHLAGVSMGGSLTGLFAAKYPELVQGISMCCPSMKTPQEGQMIASNREQVELNGGRMTLDTCPLLPQTAADLHAMLQVVSYRPGYIPRPILQGAVHLRKHRNQFYLDLVHELVSERCRSELETHLSEITCPVHVLWGEQDAVVHVSGVKVLQAKVPDLRRVDMMPRCGHAVNLDQPKVIGRALSEFWSLIQDTAQS